MSEKLYFMDIRSTDPTYNLALEEYLLLNHTQGEILLLWQNANTLTKLPAGKYIKYPKNSNCQRWIKRETSRRFRNCEELPRKGNYYRRLFDYWWTMY